MSYIPSDARWFIADLLLEIIVEGDQRNVVHRNVVLVEATSAEEAYQKSIELGENSSVIFENPDGKAVQIRFRGLAQLDVVGSELKHGTEILFQEEVGVSQDTIAKRIPPKEELNVFQPTEASNGPNYSAG